MVQYPFTSSELYLITQNAQMLCINFLTKPEISILQIDSLRYGQSFQFHIFSSYTTRKRQMVDKYPQLNWNDVCLSIYTGLLDGQSREFQFCIYIPI